MISNDDIVLITESTMRLRKNTVTDPVKVIGKRSIRNIQPDQIILSDMVEIPPLIKKGNRVLIMAENEEFKITTMGEVLEDGRSGDQVKVVNISSGKEIIATVKGPDIVEVNF